MSLDGQTGAGRRPDWAALVIAAALAAIAAVIAWDASGIRTAAAYARVGPKTFPFIVAACLAGLALWTAVAAFRRDFPEREPMIVSPIVWIVGGLAAQLLLLRPAGFSIATGLLFAATATAFGHRRLWLSLPVGIALAFAVWIVFARGLKLSLPAGPLERLFF